MPRGPFLPAVSCMETHTLTGPFEQTRGVIGRYPDPDEEYVFEFDRVALRTIHMIGVRRPLRVEWWVGDEIVKEQTLRPWIGRGRARCDRVVERRPAVDPSKSD